MKMKLGILALMVVCASNPVHSKTYYIDFQTGSDDSIGSKSHPWKHCPGMLGTSGKSKAYSCPGGDTFTFKGGAVWDSSCIPWTISGKGGNVFTIDTTWYTGASYSRPKINGMNKPVGSVVVHYNQSHNIFNGFEIYNYRALPGAGDPPCFDIYGSYYCTFSNMYVHNWHADGWTNTDGAVFQCYYDSVLTITRDTAVGVDSGGSLYFSVGYDDHTTISYNKLSGGTNGGIMPHGGGKNMEISYNDISNIWQGHFQQSAHTDGIYVFGGSGSMHHNKVHDCATMAIMFQGSNNYLVYDNAVYNINGTSAMGDATNGVTCLECTLSIYNNYIEGIYSHGRNQGGPSAIGGLKLINNIFTGGSIYITDTIHKLIIDHNLYKLDSTTNPSYITFFEQTINRFQARAKGWDSTSVFSTKLYLDTNGKPLNLNSPIIHKGKNLHALPDSTKPGFLLDLENKSRPIKLNWSIGGYEPDSSLTTSVVEPKNKLLTQSVIPITKKSVLMTYMNSKFHRPNSLFVYNLEGRKILSQSMASGIGIYNNN